MPLGAPGAGGNNALAMALMGQRGERTGQMLQPGGGGFALSPGRNPILGAAGWLPGPVGWGARGANAALGVSAERQKQDAMSQFTGRPAGSWAQSLWGGSTGLGKTYDMGGYGVPGQGGLTGMINNLDPGVANKPGAFPRAMANAAARNYAATGQIGALPAPKTGAVRPQRETARDRDYAANRERAVREGRMDDRTGRSIGNRGGV